MENDGVNNPDRRFRRCRSLAVALVFLPLAVMSLSGYAMAAGLLVFYPQARAPYAKVYQDIIKGISATFKGPTVAESVGGRDLEPVVGRVDPQLILALGREGADKVKDLPNRVPVIVGAIPSSIDGFPGVSMAPEAELVIEKLLLLAPEVKNVHVVVARKTGRADLDAAAEYLGAKGKNLAVLEADSVVQAAEQYRKITERANATDAIWIPQGDKLIDSTLLSVLLDAAWTKRIIIFSSSLHHVRRGTLFAVFPDNYRMGEQLGALANDHLTNPGGVPPTLVPLRHVLLGVNERTINHLGLNLADSVRRQIDLSL